MSETTVHDPGPEAAGTRGEAHAEAVWQHARDIVGEPAAGDMGDATHLECGREREHRLHVDARRCHQLLDEARAGDFGRGIGAAFG